MQIRRIQQLVTFSQREEKKLNKLKTLTNMSITAGAGFALSGAFVFDNYLAGVLALGGMGIAGYANLLISQMYQKYKKYADFGAEYHFKSNSDIWDRLKENKELFEVLDYVSKNIKREWSCFSCKINDKYTLHRFRGMVVFITDENNQLCHAYFNTTYSNSRIKWELFNQLVKNDSDINHESEQVFIKHFENKMKQNMPSTQSDRISEEDSEDSDQEDDFEDLEDNDQEEMSELDISQLEAEILNMREDQVEDKELELAMKFLTTKFNTNPLQLEKQKTSILADK